MKDQIAININYDQFKSNQIYYNKHSSLSGSLSIHDTTVSGQKISDVVQRLDAIEQRLAILTPDPKQLEKFETLRHIYDQYRMVEALCRESSEK